MNILPQQEGLPSTRSAKEETPEYKQNPFSIHFISCRHNGQE